MVMVLIYAMVLCFAALTRPFTILLHELGHALPALLFTRKKVELYLGSYGEREKAFSIRIGLLEIWAKYNIFWVRGLCVHSLGDLSKTQQFIILIGGVATSCLVAAMGFAGVLAFDAHGFFKLFMFFMLVFATLDIINNLVPTERHGLLSDGMQLKLLLSGKTSQAEFPQETKELIAKSRNVAIDLGCDYISTMHLFLADCEMEYPYSLVHLFFETKKQYADFYESQREGVSGSASGALPITVELEDSFRQAGMSGLHAGGAGIYPCHLFLAVCEVAAAGFASLAKGQDMRALLLDYYTALGQPVG
jgi:hypothetical protein